MVVLWSIDYFETPSEVVWCSKRVRGGDFRAIKDRSIEDRWFDLQQWPQGGFPGSSPGAVFYRLTKRKDVEAGIAADCSSATSGRVQAEVRSPRKTERDSGILTPRSTRLTRDREVFRGHSYYLSRPKRRSVCAWLSVPNIRKLQRRPMSRKKFFLQSKIHPSPLISHSQIGWIDGIWRCEEGQGSRTCMFETKIPFVRRQDPELLFDEALRSGS